MAHGHGDVDFDAELKRELPSPFCQGNWRQLTGGLAIVSFLVLGFAVEQFIVNPHEGSILAVASTAQASAAAPQVAGAAWMPPAGAALMVANTESPMGADPLNANVQLVARTERTAFNTAAAQIRPAVVGVRSTYAGVAGLGPQINRVGSGVIVDGRGFVVTCYHVVANARAIEVSRFHQSTERLPAEVVAVEDDLALLRINAPGPFPQATLASSADVQVGDWVLAVGHPFGLGLTVTAGIVGRRNSALSIPGGGQYSDLIQTDAPINEGSSGGPLVNLRGEVIGLNTAIYAPTGVFSGTGFAISSDRIRSFVSRRLALGSVNDRVAPAGRTPPVRVPPQAVARNGALARAAHGVRRARRLRG